MGKSQETFSKKEKEKERLKKRREKEEKMEARKANPNKGLSLESMMAYVNENGELSDTPPDPKKKKQIDHETIQLGAAPVQHDTSDPIRNGTIVTFFEAKGFGFIKDAANGESVFVHINNLTGDLRQGDVVTFETEHTAKGMSAVRVRKA